MINDLNRLKEKYKVEFAYILGVKLLGDFFVNVDDFFNFIENKADEFMDSNEKDYEQFIIREAEIEKGKRKLMYLEDELRQKKENEVPNKIAYQFEVGVLLKEDNPDYKSYNNVWDHNNGYYDEDTGFYFTFEEAKNYVLNYLQRGVKDTYGIISKVLISEEDYNKIEGEHESMIPRQYELDEVVYSVYKVNENLISENFIKSKEDREYINNHEDELEL